MSLSLALSPARPRASAGARPVAHKYHIVVETGAPGSWGAGTSHPVYVQLLGDQGKTREMRLDKLLNTLRYAPPPQNDKNLLASGSIREFELTHAFLGNMVKLVVRHAPPPELEYDAAWRLERVTITDGTLHRAWRFVAGRWFNADSGRTLELEHSGLISAGRRATHLSDRRLSFPASSAGLEGEFGADEVVSDVQSVRSVASATPAPDTADAVPTPASSSAADPLAVNREAKSETASESGSPRSSVHFQRSMSFFKNNPNAGDGSGVTDAASSAGVRRVCFQVTKFSRPKCHLYLTGGTDMMGRWATDRALRMRMITAVDGSFAGEWRLELEMDDTHQSIEYRYLVIDEEENKALWEGAEEGPPRSLRIVADQQLDAKERTTEDSMLFVKDIFRPIPEGAFAAPASDLATALAPNNSLSRLPSKLRVINRPAGVGLFSSPRGKRREDEPAVTAEIAVAVKDVGGRDDDNDDGNDEDYDDEGSDGDELDDEEGEDGDDGAASLDNGDGGGPAESQDLPGHTAALAAVRANAANGNEEYMTHADLIRQLKAVRSVLTETQADVLRKAATIRALEATAAATAVSTSASAVPAIPDYMRSPTSPDLIGSPSEARTSPVSSDSNSIRADEDEDASLELAADRDSTELRLLEERNSALEELNTALENQRTVLEEEVTAVNIRADAADQQLSSLAEKYHELCTELDELRATMTEQSDVFESWNAELVRLTMDAREQRRSEVKKLTTERDNALARWTKEFAQRRRLFNQVQELRGNIRVFCRVRPPKPSDHPSASADGSVSAAVRFPDIELGGDDMSSSIEVSQRRFDFDHVFPPHASQASVYEETSGVVASVLDGYNVCVFAYGQTGSGKTHTMNGTGTDPGVNYRALTDLFTQAGERSDHSEFEISVSMMEIYNEVLRDLIPESATAGGNVKDSGLPKLEIRKDLSSTSPNAVHVPNLTTVIVKSVEEVWALMERGGQNRSQHATDMNAHSSRSHLILAVNVSSLNRSSGVRSAGTLSMVDLAGSERLSRSNAEGERLKEAQHINKSLATLGDVFMALVENSGHIPYRNSKLTYLLQESLGGDSKTLMFVNTSCDDGDVGETLSSLQFAQRVARVERGAASKRVTCGGGSGTLRSSGTSSTSLAEKDSQVASLQSRVATAERDVRKRTDELDVLRKRAASAETELKAAHEASEERRRRDGCERTVASASAAASARELKDLRSTEAKLQQELRTARVKLRDIGIAKDDEIKRLKSAMDERDARIRRLELEQKSCTHRSGSTLPAPSAGTANSTPLHWNRSTSRLPSRTAMGARTFSAGQSTRQVRFESPTTTAVSAAAKASAATAAMRARMTPPVVNSLDGQVDVPPAQNGDKCGDDAATDTYNERFDADQSGDEDTASKGAASFATVLSGDGTSVEPVSALKKNSVVPSGLMAAPRRASVIPRAQTMSSLRTGRVNSAGNDGGARCGNTAGRVGIGAGRTPSGAGNEAASAEKRFSYSFGARVDVHAGGDGADAPTPRVPRSTPNLRPAQRVIPRTGAHVPSIEPTTGVSTGSDTHDAPRRTTLSAPRRAGTAPLRRAAARSDPAPGEAGGN
jgi:Kinesin motor domain/Starch binding domain/PLAT/LH2 domain